MYWLCWRTRHTVFVVVTHLGLLIGATETVGLKGLLGDLDVFLVNGRAGVSVNGVLVDTDVLGLVVGLRNVYSGVVSRAVMLAIFTLDVVNGGAVGLTVSIDLDVSVCVLVVCRSRKMVSKSCLGVFRGTVSGATEAPGPGCVAWPHRTSGQGLHGWG